MNTHELKVWPVFGESRQGPIHWRRPDGATACGVPHLDATRAKDVVCCRVHPVAATCTDCVEAAADEVAS